MGSLNTGSLRTEAADITRELISSLSRAYVSYSIARAELSRIVSVLRDFPDRRVRDLASQAYGVISYDDTYGALDALIDELASYLCRLEGNDGCL